MSQPRALGKPGWKEGVPGGFALALAALASMPVGVPSGSVATVAAMM